MAKTPADRWNSRVLGYRKQCLAILKASQAVRYVGVINSHGRTLTGVIRPGLKPMLAPEDTKNEFFIMSAIMSFRSDSAASIGKIDHALFHHRKVTILVLQKRDVTFYVTLGRNTKGLDGVISKVKALI